MRKAIILVGCTLILFSTGCGPVHEKKWNPYGYDVGPTIEEIAFFWTRPFKNHHNKGPMPPQVGYTYPATPHRETMIESTVIETPR